MVRRENERIVEMEDMFGGPGLVRLVRIREDSEELYGRGRMFSRLCLEPGCGVGYLHRGGRRDVLHSQGQGRV